MATLQDYFNNDVELTAEFNPRTSEWMAQTFTTTETYDATFISLKLSRRVGSSPGNCIFSIRATSGGAPSGADAASVTVDGSTLPEGSENAEWYDLTLSTPVALTSGVKYAIVMRTENNNLTLGVQGDSSSPSYTGGGFYLSSNSGSSWTSFIAWDLGFEVWSGYSDPTPPHNPVYYKRLVGIGNDQVWYESAADTLSELTEARSTISTANPLTAFSGLEKCFIANGSILKVLDFGNIKLQTSAVGTNIPPKTTVLTGSTSSASMVLDFLSSTSAAYLYGKSMTTLAFVSAETVTGTDSDGNAISFTLAAAQATAPHWYDWTPYANDTTTYGTMPTAATIACLYRGRCVLAGDTRRPHMWYMSKVIDPWMWQYDPLDPLSAIRGGNSDAGEIGDIITAFIPCTDDYLVIGCKNSVWLLRGDPAGAGGSLDLLSGSTGIWGQSAWCIDDNNTIYFYGTNGIYSLELQGGQGVPINISNAKIPRLSSDWAVSNDTHKVIMYHDVQRKGFVTAKVTISSGTTEAYYYDLSVQGFFPEVYPDNLAPMAPYFYKAADDSYTKLLVGGYDGYVRSYSDTDKSDEDTTDAVISSYIALPISQIVPDSDQEGIITEVVVETAGGRSSGNFGDADVIDLSFYTGDDAETVLEDIKDGATAFLTIALTSAGRKTKIREHIRAKYVGIKLSNSAISSGWAVNRIFGNAELGGKL